jgi:hypothetical protein
VKNYYTALLKSRGWSLSGEENVKKWFQDYGAELKFRKEDFLIAILHINRPTTDYQYAISCVWRDHSSSLWRNE